MTARSCAQIVRQASDYLDDALSPSERATVEEHLDSCDACPCYLSQLRTTIGVIGDHPGIEVPAPLKQALSDVMVATDEGDTARRAAIEFGPHLLALANTYDPRSAQDLVQRTWVRAFNEGSGAFDRKRLVQILTELATPKDVIDVGSLQDDRVEAERSASFLDADADTAELFYPDFYTEGPDVGAWIEPPNAWPGIPRILSPEDDLTTTELYAAVDTAIGELPPRQGQVLSLIDIEGLAIDHVAGTLNANPAEVGRALHQARNHVRGALDRYLAPVP